MRANRPIVTTLLGSCVVVFSLAKLAILAEKPQVAQPSPQLSAELHRSPVALAVSPNHRMVVTANRTSGSITLINLQTSHVVEVHLGDSPTDVVWLSDHELLVSLRDEGTVAFAQFEGDTLKVTEKLEIGSEPHGIALDKNFAFIALAGDDQVAVLDRASRQVTRRIPVGGLPRQLIVSPDGRYLITLCNVPGQVFVHDAKTYEELSRRNVFDYGFNLGVPVVLPDSHAVLLPSQVNRTFPVTPDNIEKGWAIDNRVTKLPLPSGEYWQQKQINLDVRGDAAGDVNSLALSPRVDWLAACCGGTHELLLVHRDSIPWPKADPGDFLPDKLRYDEESFKRVELGGRPVDVQFVDERTAVVANYLLDAVQVVDILDAKLLRTIPLGGPPEQSLVRRGEAIFYDADRSLDGWFSCHSCHPDGHTAGQTFDTINDGNYDTYKLTPSLYGVTKTAPWTWHGWQTSLSAAAEKSLKHTLASDDEVTDEDVSALLAFLQTLEPPKEKRTNDETEADQLKQGRKLFSEKAGCATCHQGDYLTAGETFTVGLESSRDYYPEFNPPSLRAISHRRRFLHDGRSYSLEEVLTKHHRPEELAGEALNDTELAALIAYLKSL